MAKIFVENFVFQPKRKTAAEWESENPILRDGEFGLVTDGTDGEWLKVGDGVTAWNSLAYKKGPKGETGPRGEKGDKGNTMFASFEINNDGNLIMSAPDEYTGPKFEINRNGELEVIING